ncbi:pyridoxal 5'-phosphate synthase glutaminase subunit PdxT [Candidatus Daviesbacteria bacterium]|nr:pyridoxal 5'-phosphate synthase glutaminase subunit PdxT [Candidatus Daviesbacteria bacterium]
MIKIGVLAFHGDVIEHIEAVKKASKNLHINNVDVIPVRTKEDLEVDGLIIPGGESTTLFKLCQREGMFGKMKKIKKIFGTCAGAIMLAKNVLGAIDDQKTLELMDITVDRNAYGRQAESFEKRIETTLGKMEAVFIRAPKIKSIKENVQILAKDEENIIACEQKEADKYYLATCFHPELTTTIFHEYFLKKINPSS